MGVTFLASDVAYTDKMKRYDAVIKRLLSNKPILAWIMKECIEEYASYTIEEIQACIEGSPEVGKTAVHQDTGESISETETERIIGISTEDTSISEGIVRYDIRFRARIPDKPQSVSLIINIEGQNQEKPGYPLTKRGIYYCSRMISSQYGTIFTNSEYSKIKKVYSIFICLNAAKKRQNSIVKYTMNEEIQCGTSDIPKEDYDLLTLVMIYMGSGNRPQGSQSLLRMLQLLLSPDYKQQERLQLLEEEYGIIATHKMKKEVQSMCNLSVGILEQGISQGISQGINQGIQQTAINMLKMHLPMDVIQQATGLTEQQIEILKDDICE